VGGEILLGNKPPTGVGTATAVTARPPSTVHGDLFERANDPGPRPEVKVNALHVLMVGVLAGVAACVQLPLAAWFLEEWISAPQGPVLLAQIWRSYKRTADQHIDRGSTARDVLTTAVVDVATGSRPRR